MKKVKKEVWRGLTAVFSFFMILVISGTSIALKIPSTINTFLGINSTVKIVDSGDGNEDTTYYKTANGSSDVNDIDALNETEKSIADEIIATEEEGAVLLKNDNNALPLKEGSNVTMLGASTVNYNYGGGGMGGERNVYSGWTDDYDGYVAKTDIVEAMKSVYNVNTTLIDAYTKSSDQYPGKGIKKEESSQTQGVGKANQGPSDGTAGVENGEAPAEFYTSNLTDTFSSYGDAAIISFTRDGGEGNDVSMRGGVDGTSVLALQPNEKELLEMVQSYKENGTFSEVIVLLNTNNVMEVGELDDYGVDAILWVGNPGTQGCFGIVNILTGAVSPSGRLVDTYAANSLSAPACMNANDNSQYYSNASEVLDYCGYNDTDYSGEQNYTSYIVNAEDIYIGYKYYETRYEDTVLGQGNADSTAGTYASKAGWNYNEEVVYPFGYGLSYTTFEQKLDDVTYNADTDSYEVSVTVTNTGDTYAGKSVVEVYAQTPYGDYEKENEVEKSAVQLAGFAKTGTLEPGESETVKVNVQKYFLASYDSNGAKGYILSEGDYYLAVGDNAHDALNNILAAKGADGMTDVAGNTTAGDADKAYSWNQDKLDTTTYRMSRVDDSVEVTNQFDDADFNYWQEGTVTYLSRSDWEGTYPITYTDLTATKEMMEVLKGQYEQPENAPSVDDYTQGEDNGITFAMMMDVDYDDDEAWDKFLDQFTVEEMTTLAADTWGSDAVESVGVPAVKRADDGTSLADAFIATPDELGQVWPSEMVTSSTFNTDRYEARGELIGSEATFIGYNEVWYGGGNIHRTPFGGRNGQYYSEDGVLGYYVGANEAKGMQSVGINYCVKHFAGNDQETNRESIGTFFKEQAFREIDLKVFEGTFTEGKAYSVMGAFNRIGCLYANYSYPLMTEVLRDEWGFEGHVTTDAIAGSLYKTNWTLSMAAGTDYFCYNGLLSAMGGTGDDVNAGMKKAIDNGDGYALQSLRRATKNNVNAYLHTVSVNGLSSDSKIVISTPWWQYALYVLIGLFSVLTVATFAMYLYNLYYTKKKERE